MPKNDGQIHLNTEIVGFKRVSRHISYALAILCIVWTQNLYSQSIFTSNLSGGTGDWDDAATWTENNQGNPNDSDGIPDSDDDVVITAGDIVTLNPSGTTTIVDLTTSGTLDIASNNRTLAVTGNLVMSGSGALTGSNNNRIVNVTGTLTVSSGATASISGIQINVSGITTLDGALAFTSTTGNKSFNTIDVNASGTWDNSTVAEDFTLNGNIINDGTWNGCFNNSGCLYDFTSSSAAISGSSTLTLADIRVNSPAALTNNGTILLTDDLTGSGTFTNGATGDFQIQGTGPFSLSTIDFSTIGNTVTYTNIGNTTMISATYHDVIVAKDLGTRAQLASTITVNNDITVTSGEFRINAGTANISGDLLIQGGEFSPNNASAIANITGDLNMSSGTYDQNNGDVNLTGDLIVSGGTMTMNGTGSTVDVDDFTIATGTVTLTQGALNVNNASGGLTVNSGSLTMANAAITLDIDGTYTVAGGTNDLNNGTLNVANWTVNNTATVLVGGISPNVTGTTTVNGTFTGDNNGGTKNLNDIIVSSTGNWNVTATEGFTINGDIDVDGIWTDCSSATGCVYVLTNSSGVLSGTTSLEFSDLSIDAPASYTSNTDVTITDELIGTGSFINGNGSTLTLSGAGPFSISTLDATTVSNTVIYGGVGNVNINGATYHNLTVSKSGNTATIASAVNVNNDLTISSITDVNATTTVSNDVIITAGILEVNAATLGVTNNIDIQAGEFTPVNTASVVNVGGNISMSDGLYDQNDGDVNITGDLIITGGALTLNQATTSTIDASDFSIATGSATLNSGQLNVTNASGGLTIASGTLTMAGATAAITNAYTVNGGTNQLNGGLLTADVMTIALGATVNLGDASLTISDATSIDGTLTVDDNGGTKTFNDITVNATGDWNVAAQEGFTVNGNIVNNGTWTGCSNTTGCLYDLTNSSGSISGSTQTVFTDLNLTAPASYTNTGDILITDELIGTGTFTNGNGSTLELSGAGPFSVSTFSASTPTNTVTYSGGSNPTLNSGSYYNLLVNKSSGTINIASATTVANDLTVQSGVLTVGATTLDVTNDVTVTGGEFSPNNIAAIVNVGNNLSMSSGLLDHIDGDVNITGDLQITGGTMTMNQSTVTSTIDADNFTIATGSVTLSEGELNVNSVTGGLTVNSGALTLGATSVTVTNDININGGTNDYNNGSLSGVDFNIASGQTVNLGDVSFTATGNTTLDGTLTTDDNGGTKSFSNVTVNGTGNWNVTAGESFNISGDITNNGSWTGCPSNGCDYTLTSSSGSLTGANPISFSDLIIDSPANYSSSTTITVSDRFTGSGTFTNIAGNSLTLGGGTNDVTNFTTSGVGTTVTYNRSGGDQGLNPTTDGQYYNLVISTDAAGNDVTMSSSETIANQLSLTTGDLFLGANTLTLEDGATISGGSADSYLGINGAGLLRQNYSGAGATLSFPIGDANDYSPISSFTINSGTFGAGAYVEFDLTDANLGTRNTSNTGSGGDDDGTAAVDYISRYWDLSANNITDANYDATYVYVDADVVGTTEGNMIGTVYRTPPGFGFNDWGVFGTVDPLTNTVTVTNVDGFGTLFAMDNTSNRLPIVLISFEARASGSKVLLNWSTATEINNNFFTIQRSRDASNWQDIITVDGAGNSDGVLNYNVNDNFPLGGRSFYRLKQTDFDGSFTYSEVSSVLVADEITPELFLYPNPVSSGDLVNISLSSDVSDSSVMRLMNMKGEVLMEKELNTSQTRVATSGLQKGVYLVVIRNSTGVFKKKLVIN